MDRCPYIKCACSECLCTCELTRNTCELEVGDYCKYWDDTRGAERESTEA